MIITIREFQVAMETYGAERLPNRLGLEISVSGPCFKVAGTYFLHSGSYYIVQKGKKVPEETMNHAMTELGEKYPGGDHFWYDEICSVKGLLTLTAMIEGKYSKEKVDELTNKTYKKLLECPVIQNNVEFPFNCKHSPKMEKLYKLLAEYSNIVNPFGNNELKLKEPIQYFDVADVSLTVRGEHDTKLKIFTNSILAKFDKNEDGWSYDTFVLTQRNRINGYINMGHYYVSGSEGRPEDEVICLECEAYKGNNNGINLRISLKTGMAWKTFEEKQAKPATDEQIETMITYLKMTIKKIRKLINKMVI